VTFYYVVLTLFAAALLFLGRLGDRASAWCCAASRATEPRMESRVFATDRFKLAAFVIAGALRGCRRVDGDQNSFVSPNMMHWEQSGVALVMVVWATGAPLGAGCRAAAFLVLEEVLSGFTAHWQIFLGAIMLGVVFFARAVGSACSR